MSLRCFIWVIILFITCLAGAQNLVPNGGFEQFTMLPDNYGQANRAVGWTNVNLNYSGPPFGSPDYYHASGSVGDYFGQIAPYSGSAQMGFATYKSDNINFREYVAVKLSPPLEAGKHYHVSFWLSNGMGGAYTFRTNNIGVHFSVSPHYQEQAEPIILIPHFEIPVITSHYNEWIQYTFNITPDQDLNYMTFGNFNDDVHTEVSPNGTNGAYYFIDHVKVIPTANNLQIIGDKEICYGETITLYAIGDEQYRWATSLDPNGIISTDSILVITPLTTTTYYVYGTSDTVSLTVQVHDPIELDLGQDILLCEGETLDLDVTTWYATYLWQDSTNKPGLTVTKPGTYWVDVTIDGCTARDSIIVSYQTLPDIDLGHDLVLCPGEYITLDAYYPGASYRWQDNSGSSNLTAQGPGLYWVEVTMNGCSSADSLRIYFDDEYCNCKIFVPNAFSPNGDGLNDNLTPMLNCPLEQYNFSIYDRWGRILFETNEAGTGWDGRMNGKSSPAGVYLYLVSYTFLNGSMHQIKKGSVTLVK